MLWTCKSAHRFPVFRVDWNTLYIILVCIFSFAASENKSMFQLIEAVDLYLLQFWLYKTPDKEVQGFEYRRVIPQFYVVYGWCWSVVSRYWSTVCSILYGLCGFWYWPSRIVFIINSSCYSKFIQKLSYSLHSKTIFGNIVNKLLGSLHLSLSKDLLSFLLLQTFFNIACN